MRAELSGCEKSRTSNLAIHNSSNLQYPQGFSYRVIQGSSNLVVSYFNLPLHQAKTLRAHLPLPKPPTKEKILIRLPYFPVSPFTPYAKPPPLLHYACIKYSLWVNTLS